MRYANLKAIGYGSGVVEAAKKALINQRMKRARWSRRSERPAQTKRRLTVEVQKQNRNFTKIDLHPYWE